MNEKDYQSIVEKLDIVQVIGEYVSLKKTGANYTGLSPFKEERTPSFVVSPAKNIFKDFASGIGGNVITFYMKINDLSFREALQELSQKYNLLLPNFSTKVSAKDKERAVYYEIVNKTHKYYKENLVNSKIAQDYLTDRNFTLDDMKKYGLGFASADWSGLYDYLISEGYNENIILTLGLVKKSENGNVYDNFRSRIIFPITNKSGRTIGFGGRLVGENENAPKYLNSSESIIFNKGKELFGLFDKGDTIKRRGFAILMEGYMDVLTANKYGFDSSVASLGTSLTDDQVKLLKNYTNNIIIAYDNDTAGRNAVIKASGILKKYDFNVKCFVTNKEAKDPDEYIKKYGKEEFSKELKMSVDIFDYLYSLFSNDLNLTDTAGKKEFVKRLKPFFSSLSNKLEIDIYISKLSQELGIDKNVLSSELSVDKRKKIYREKSKKYENSTLPELKKILIGKYDMLEKLTLKLLFSNTKYLDTFGDKKFSNSNYCIALDILKNKKNGEDNSYEKSKLLIDFECQEDISKKEEEYQFKILFMDWFKREIEEKKLENVDDRGFKFKLIQIKQQLKNLHKIEEIVKLYDEFKLL